MRPRVLDIGRQRHDAAFLECGILDFHAIQRELAADARIEDRFALAACPQDCLGESAGATAALASSVVSMRRSIIWVSSRFCVFD